MRHLRIRPRARLRAVLIPSGLVLGLVAVIGVWSTNDRSSATTPTVLPSSQVFSAIDRPAVDRAVPPDAVVNVKTAFGAKGDGRTDDTAAIQAAVSAVVGLSNTRGVLFFPAGTYLVSKSIEWRASNGSWATQATLMGQNRDRTIIKLADRARTFGNPSTPRAVLVTASQNANVSDGSGNQAFNNFVVDLTVDVGTGNPGADGIDYLANNRGALRNIVVQAPAGSGRNGITMTRSWPGPALIEDVRITGFGTGIAMSRTQYSMTMEDVRLSGQRTAGIANQGNVLTVRRLISENSVPAVSSVAGFPPGLLTMIDSQLTGGDRRNAAVVSDGGAFLRRVTIGGYVALIKDRGVNKNAGPSGEWTSEPPELLFGAQTLSINLPIQENPDVPTVPIDQMAGVGAFGARPDDNVDDSNAIQAALSSGKPVVYLRAGRYIVSRTMIVPASVQAIVGFEATINATIGGFAGNSTAAVFRSTDNSAGPLILAQLLFTASRGVVDLERTGTRPIALTDVHISGLPVRGGTGPIFLTDVEGGQGWQFGPGQQVWARQFNAEQPFTKVRNNGAQLWILGLKTESLGTAIDSTAGARTEVLGALLYPVSPAPDNTPAFASTDSALSVVFATNGGQPNTNYQVLVAATRNGQQQRLLPADAPRRGAASLVPLANVPG